MQHGNPAWTKSMSKKYGNAAWRHGPAVWRHRYVGHVASTWTFRFKN
jgi:hypothetical protein